MEKQGCWAQLFGPNQIEVWIYHWATICSYKRLMDHTVVCVYITNILLEQTAYNLFGVDLDKEETMVGKEVFKHDSSSHF